MSQTHPLSSARRAFTLIEMIIVIMIIGLLIALLLPAVNKARSQAQAAQCASQLHQIYTASAASMQATGNLTDFASAGWTGTLAPYLRNTNVYICPIEAGNVTASSCCLVPMTYRSGK